MKEHTKSGLATAGMVLGIIAIVGAWIPFLNIGSIIMGVLALIFGGVALLKKKSTGKAVAAVVLGVASIIIAIAMLVAASKAIDSALSPTKTSTDTSQSDKKGSTKATFDGAAAFDKVTTGMSKQQVRDIAGVDPATCTENESEALGKTEYCSYGNMFTDKVTFDVVYSQGVVSSKTKSTH